MHEGGFLQLGELYQQLYQHYPDLEPHAKTWKLWLKPNKKPSELFEVAIGTILVQNTNWQNVNRAVTNLKNAKVMSFEELHKIDLEQLKELVKPAGFYNQKATYLQALCTLLMDYQARGTLPSRQQLLACKGIGNETADSILVYCFQLPVPVVGTYTRRVLARIRGDVKYLKLPYEVVQNEQHKELPQDPEILGRFHALIVCHSQNRCQKVSPKCENCFLRIHCMYGQYQEVNSTIAQIQTYIQPMVKRKFP